MREKTFYLVSLGCAKNTVDSESMGSLLTEQGYQPVEKASQAEVMIVNTCGFISAARQESYDTLKELAAKKRPGQFLIAAGCLTERSRQLLSEQVAGVDGFIGTRRWMDILDVISEVRQTPQEPRYHLPDAPSLGTDEKGTNRVAVQGASAYLKIADGCRRPCAFCSIPLIKGTLVSRAPELVIRDAVQLQSWGVKEINLIAQDTTDYGHDLGMKDGLATLLETMLPKIPQIPWVRLLYAYPGYVTDHLIEVMASQPQIVHYLDIPLQHADPELLKSMKRPSDVDWVLKTVDKMRTAMPDLSLRTTFIVGYPGETEEKFQTLLNFLDVIQFDHVGAFTFSFEPGTASEPLGDPVPEEVKLDRLERLMKHQEKISLNHNQKWIGKQLDVLIEGQGDGISVGRSFRDAPEIDGLVIIEDELEEGKFFPIQITGSMTHDLTGQLAE
ncbi:MAG: 30S ribosomal protein S12 methylthiotransferase RimO [Anaerolineaceae bacterium]|nr:30S ribosomal protein S12 methylthiotransferase RimO [Anaerolineaceae bacterium]